MSQVIDERARSSPDLLLIVDPARVRRWRRPSQLSQNVESLLIPDGVAGDMKASVQRTLGYERFPSLDFQFQLALENGSVTHEAQHARAAPTPMTHLLRQGQQAAPHTRLRLGPQTICIPR